MDYNRGKWYCSFRTLRWMYGRTRRALIASILFYIEAWNRVNEKLSCTQVKCSWLMPMAVREVPYTPVSDIDYRSAKKLDQTINGLTTSEGIAKSGEVAKVLIPVPDETDLRKFYTELNSCKTKPVSLSLIHPFSS